MFRRIAFLVLIAALALVLIQGVALAQDPTIPTRTPTPDPNAATATSVPPTQDSGGGQPPAPPTATSEPPPSVPTATATSSPGGAPAATATPTATATAAAPLEVAPGGTFVVQECGTQPYVAALADILVYAGPGVDYPVISSLQRPEIRPIVGRAEFAPWWQIQLTPDLNGWVADADVDEFGDTGGVPLVDVPLLNGVEPTRGPLWQPTPIPFAACTATPSPTPSPSPTATATTAAGSAEAIVSAEDDGAGGGPDGDESAAVSVADITAAGSRGEAEFESSGAAAAKQLQDAELAIAEATGEQAAGGSPLSGWLFPLLGLGLVGAGLILAFMARGGSSAAGATEGDSEEG